MAISQLPLYGDFQIAFTNVTKDGAALSFSTVQSWEFSMGSNLTGAPLIHMVSTGVAHSGSFAIDPMAKSVIVAVSASGFVASGGGAGTYYIALYANTSGNYTTHLQKAVNIQQTLRRV